MTIVLPLLAALLVVLVLALAPLARSDDYWQARAADQGHLAELETICAEQEAGWPDWVRTHVPNGRTYPELTQDALDAENGPAETAELPAVDLVPPHRFVPHEFDDSDPWGVFEPWTTEPQRLVNA